MKQIKSKKVKILCFVSIILVCASILTVKHNYESYKTEMMNQKKYPVIATGDVMKSPELEDEINNAPICVVAKVVKGIDDCDSFTVSGTDLFGNTKEDKVMMEKMQEDGTFEVLPKKDGLLPDTVSYQQFELEVEEYMNESDYVFVTVREF